jgi:IS5 family transposase
MSEQSDSGVEYRQQNFFHADLLDQLDPKDELMLLSKKIPWEKIISELSPLYSEVGRRAKPIRMMVGLLLLKQLENKSDEVVVKEWKRNPYYQCFCGEINFQTDPPCDATDLVYFRRRLGEAGMEKIFQMSVELHGKSAGEKEIIVDTTVQEKNITFPTDTKLRTKIIRESLDLAKSNGVKLRRSYKKELRAKLRTIRFNKSKKKCERRKVRTAQKRVLTIARTLVRELERKLPEEIKIINEEKLLLWKKVLLQKRDDKKKIYSLHEPAVLCICKGKERKKYEFGSKAAIAVTKSDCVIVGVKNFSENVHDSKTLDEVLLQVKNATGDSPKFAYCDRGFRGVKRVGETEIILPDVPKEDASEYHKRKMRFNFRRRSAIEPVIGHLKSDFRLARNYLRGVVGDAINLLLSAAAFNLRKFMRALACFLFFHFFAVQKNEI